MVEMKDNNFFNVIIIGGGPAGIAAGLTLNSRNISTVIVEANQLSNQKVGECIPPNAYPLFQKMGLESLLVDEKHHLYYGNKSVWGTSVLHEKLFLFDRYNKGILLNRTYFEKQLQDISKRNQINWLVDYTLYTINKEKNFTKVVLKSKTDELTLFCNYVVDATGRKASVCRKLGIEKKTLDQLASLSFKCQIKTTIPFYVHTESFENGWIYVSPSEGDNVIVMIFTDLDLIPSKNKGKDFILDIMNNSQLGQKVFKTRLEEDNIFDITTRIANTTYLEKPFGGNWLAIGDAAYSFDPLSSYGITSALASGYYGGHALADILLKKEEALDVYHYIMRDVFENYKVQLHEQYALESRWANSIFWSRRN
ncbi:NAD(P)/FAD-dependent oxidoreductase [Flavobacterium sp. 316]|uniref:NAD(P)/FAD-dependent oxidoreductase n=1 Tax=Flavobacterium sp. 316 TaxID=1603293 RepID=UPI000697C8AF|nr:FAD-dependent monooxygenase [Flavobacterium sp. 316]